MWIDIDSIVDHFTIVPTIVGIYYDNNWLGKHSCIAWTLYRITPPPPENSPSQHEITYCWMSLHGRLWLSRALSGVKIVKVNVIKIKCYVQDVPLAWSCTRIKARIHGLMYDGRRSTVCLHDSGKSICQMTCGGQSSSSIDWCNLLVTLVRPPIARYKD